MIHKFFPSSKKHDLLISYRSTIQIIQFANSVLKKKAEQSVVRNGKLPEVRRIKNNEELCLSIYSILENSKKSNYKIAILVKSNEEANEICNIFPSWKLMTEENQLHALSRRTIITTIYLSKGLEFDVVIIPNLEKSNFFRKIDQHYLYIAITRALHEFYGFYRDDISEFVNSDYILNYD
jgi:DNA helicase-2/ATP-dependent DNA helicase PcrA